MVDRAESSAAPTQLPAGFAALEPFVGDWVLADSQARTDKRHASEFDDLKSFYDMMLAHAEAALDYLRERQLGDLSACDERLLKLMLALAEVGPCIEWYGQNAVRDGFDPERFRLTLQLSDTDAQSNA